MASPERYVLSVRPASADDEPALEGLRDRVDADLSVHRGGADLVASVRSVPEGDADLHLVAEVGGLLVGEAQARLVTSPDGRLGCRLERIATDPDVRGVGVGHQLLLGARAWATDHGARSIEAVALPGDRSTKNFLEAHGLVAHLITARGDLGGRP